MRHFATESGKSKGQFYTPAEVSRIMAMVIDLGSAKIAEPDHLRPDLRLRLAAAQGARRGQEPHRPRPRALRPGDGQRHLRPGAHEHGAARLPDGGNLAGQHPVQPALQERRRQPQDLRLRRRQSAVLQQDLDQRPRPGQRPLWPLRVRHPAGQERRLRLPAAHPRQPQEHRQGRGHSSPRRAVPGRRRGGHPHATSSGRASSRASSACPPTCSTAPASRPASSCWTRKARPAARASS